MLVHTQPMPRLPVKSSSSIAVALPRAVSSLQMVALEKTEQLRVRKPKAQ